MPVVVVSVFDLKNDVNENRSVFTGVAQLIPPDAPELSVRYWPSVPVPVLSFAPVIELFCNFALDTALSCSLALDTEVSCNLVVETELSCNFVFVTALSWSFAVDTELSESVSAHASPPAAAELSIKACPSVPLPVLSFALEMDEFWIFVLEIAPSCILALDTEVSCSLEVDTELACSLALDTESSASDDEAQLRPLGALES